MPVVCYTKSGKKIEPEDIRIPVDIQIDFMEQKYGGKWEVVKNETPNRQTLVETFDDSIQKNF